MAFFGISHDNCSNYEYFAAARPANNSVSKGLRFGGRILFAVKLRCLLCTHLNDKRHTVIHLYGVHCQVFNLHTE